MNDDSKLELMCCNMYLVQSVLLGFRQFYLVIGKITQHGLKTDALPFYQDIIMIRPGKTNWLWTFNHYGEIFH